MGVEGETVDLEACQCDPACAMHVPAQLAFQRRIVPLCMVDSDLIVAMADPSDVQTIAALRRLLGVPIVPKRADSAAIDAFLEKLYGDVNSLLADVDHADAVSTVDYLVRAAYLRHASDIHFDPMADGDRVRFRVDGELEDVMKIPPGLQASVTSRLKVLADLKLDERRAPQDGAFTWQPPDMAARGKAPLDIRLATLPGRYGERVTLRLLEKETRLFSISELGFSAEDRVDFENVLSFPHGLILLTGPTGSGKTTTLYASIRYLLGLRPLNIITIENPIEYEIPGIFQAQVDGADKVNFSKALRSILRHDPDVIMIGEIRDAESLDTAVKAALTGHLVLSTLHTNTAINAVTRLANMGLERHLIAATLRLSVAQRLVRKLCPYCRERYEIDADEANACGVAQLAGQTAWRSRGCVYCAGRGMRGRIGLFEFFKSDSDLAAAMSSGTPEGELQRMWREHGGRYMLEDGLAKVLSGDTGLREVMRVARLA